MDVCPHAIRMMWGTDMWVCRATGEGASKAPPPASQQHSQQAGPSGGAFPMQEGASIYAMNINALVSCFKYGIDGGTMCDCRSTYFLGFGDVPLLARGCAYAPLVLGGYILAHIARGTHGMEWMYARMQSA